MGRPRKLTAHQRREARQRRGDGDSLSAMATSFNVHPATVSRLCA